MCQKIIDKTQRTDSYYLPNWIDENDVNPAIAKQHAFIKNHSDKFIVLYSGNIGKKQDWNSFIETVKQLQTHENIHFVVVGDGATKDILVDATKDLKNMTLYQPVAFDDLGDLLCSPDMHILCQKTDVIDTVMPSKILGMFASAKPSVVTGNKKSEIATLFDHVNAGYFIDNNNVSDIVKAIIDCAENKEKSVALGKNAREYILSHFSKSAILQKFHEKLSSLNVGV